MVYLTKSSGRPGRSAPGSTTGVPPGQKQVFYTDLVPAMWRDLVAVFSHTIVYHYIDGGSVNTQALVYEGVEGEAKTIGRYTHVMVDNATLARVPMAGDWVVIDGINYDIVTVDALIVNLSRLVVQGQRV